MCWPDFGLPLNGASARRAIRGAWDRSATQRVEVVCGGGVGRTGTALAAMAMLDGLDADTAVDWVRARYHPRAVETPWQRWWLRNQL
ncbi:MAG: protein-tyrosine phosphatase family protein [Mobilicoccus sp.]|nr:protein-tyrosine phosphatase family protein [Mobilicoccus sp.]